MKGLYKTFFFETELTLSLHNHAGGWSQSFAENEQGSEHTCGGSIPCDNALQVVKDLVTVAFVKLFPHIGKVISKEHSANIIRLTKFSVICIFRYLMRKR